jgi:hypothetical protein
MKSNDPASLQNLNDIVLPASVEWWPLATGWYVLFVLMLVAIGWYGYRALQRWHTNRYRRVALQELTVLKEAVLNDIDRETSLRQLPVLLKRTALAAYPRSQVASLSDSAWFSFLNSTLSSPAFTESSTETLSQLSYSVGNLSSVNSHAASELFLASTNWIKHHQSSTRSNAAVVN